MGVSKIKDEETVTEIAVIPIQTAMQLLHKKTVTFEDKKVQLMVKRGKSFVLVCVIKIKTLQGLSFLLTFSSV